MTEGQKRANERLFAVASSSRILDEEEVISSSDDEENTLAKKSKESLINKIVVLEGELQRAKAEIKKMKMLNLQLQEGT